MTVPRRAKHRSAKAKPPRSGGPKECHAILPMRGRSHSAGRRSERWRVFRRGRTEVRRCAGRFERAVTMVLLLRDNRDDRGWICRVVARSLSARQLPRLRRSHRVLPQCRDSVAMGAIADTADAHSKRRFGAIRRGGESGGPTHRCRRRLRAMMSC
jgi:hypothetical protein